MEDREGMLVRFPSQAEHGAVYRGVQGGLVKGMKAGKTARTFWGTWYVGYMDPVHPRLKV